MTRLGRFDQRFFILDYETTGVDPNTDHPIEVGIIVADGHFRLLETYQAFIEVPDGIDPWAGDALGAFKVHGIFPEEWQSHSQPRAEVGSNILNLARKHTIKERRPVLVSDNIQFEWAFTKLLIDLTGERWPFHYCGWDSSLMLEATGVGDPKPAHRALADAGLLHAAIVAALDRTRGCRE